MNFLERQPLIVEQKSPDGSILQRIFIYTHLPKKVRTAVEHRESKAHDGVLKEYFGERWEQYVPSLKVGTIGGDEDELKEIEALLYAAEGPTEERAAEVRDATIAATQRVIFDRPLFPEDNLVELKEKLALITNIPVYRMFIRFSRVSTSFARSMTHQFLFGGVQQAITAEDDTADLYGLAVDNTFYANRTDTRVVANDDKLLLSNFKDPLMLVDLFDLKRSIAAVGDDLPALLESAHARERLYYAHVRKYFPYLSPETFNDYLRDEASLGRYPRLARSWTRLGAKYAAQDVLMQELYARTTKPAAFEINITRAFVVYQMLVHQIASSEKIVNVRNLFDRFATDPTYYGARVKISQKDSADSRVREFNVYKYHKSALIEGLPRVDDERIQPPEAARAHDRVTIYAKTNGLVHVIMVTDRGMVFVVSNWPDNSNSSFEQLLERVGELVRPVATLVEAQRSYIFQTQVAAIEVRPLGAANSRILSMNISLTWRRASSARDLLELRKTTDAMVTAGMFTYANVQIPDQINGKLSKGAQDYISAFVIRGVEVEDYYQYLTIPSYWDRWAVTYEGKKLNVIRRISSMLFNIAAVSAREFVFFQRVCQYLTTVMEANGSRPDESAQVRQIKKMLEVDPELYNLGKGAKLYSTIVQKKYRPEILTPEENAALKDRKYVHEYYNHTTGKPAYYRCHKSLPDLAFVPGKHPKGYCLPKCNSGIVPGTKTARVAAECHANHGSQSSRCAASERYVARYTSEYVAGKVSKLPPVLYDVFYELSERELYAQTLSNTYKQFFKLWPLEALALAQDTEIGTVVDRLIAGWDDSMFLSSVVSETLETPGDFRELLTALKAPPTGVPNYFGGWFKILVSLAETLFGVFFITFRLSGEKLSVDYSLGAREAYGRGAGQYLVALYINNQSELTNNARLVQYNGFMQTASSPLVKRVMELQDKERGFAVTRALADKLLTGHGYKPVAKFVRRGLVYAVLYEKKREFFYCSTDKHAPSADGVPVRFEPFDRREYLLRPRKVLELVNELTDSAPLAQVLLVDKLIGFQFMGYYYWCSDGDALPDMRSETLLYEPYEVNQAIHKKAKPAFDPTLANRTEYSNRSYFLFKLHVVSQLLNKKDKKVREQVKSAVDAGPTHSEVLSVVARAIPYASDVLAFRVLYNGYVNKKLTREQLFKMLDETSFEFDNKLTREYSDSPQLESTVRKVVAATVVTGELPSDPPTFPNSMVLCKGKDAAGYCEGGKLRVAPADLEPFTELLLAEVRDRMLFAYNLASLPAGVVVNPFRFESRPGEIIRVRAVEGE